MTSSFPASHTGAMAIVGSASWFVALVAAATAWRRAGAPWYAVMALGLSGVLLGTTHIRPIGPLACLCFLVGGAWVVFRTSQGRAQTPGVSPR